jgi:hypothetical protein
MKEEDENDSLENRFIIINLGQFNHDEFMEVFYNLLKFSPNSILEYDEDTNVKIEKLNYILDYFKEREEYEKCAKIKNIQEMLRESIAAK